MSAPEADAIIITRANLTDDIKALKTKIAKYNPNGPIFVCQNKTKGLLKLKDFLSTQSFSPTPKANPKEKGNTFGKKGKGFAFCGLGNPENFFDQLRFENFELAGTKDFPDHHFYTQKDIQTLEKKASEADAVSLFTTAKDAVKLRNLKFNLSCFVVENDLVFEDEKGFQDFIYANCKAG